MTAAEILKKPYGRLLVPEDDGTYRAEIIEFPGCFAVGNTAAEAAENLENAAVGWVESTLAKGRTIPDPMDETDYSGKLVLRMPKSLHRHAAFAANRVGVRKLDPKKRKDGIPTVEGFRSESWVARKLS